jgi:hypothetical protein
MRRIVLVLTAIATLLAAPVMADEVWNITGSANVSGSDGLVLQIDEVGFPAVELHTFVENGHHRLHAIRDLGVSTWDLITPAAYLTPTTSMSVNDSWVFLPTDDGESTTATVKAIESITVPAGTFDAYRVETSLDANPSILDSVFWFADGVGIVRQDYHSTTLPGNPLETRANLTSFSIAGGSGFFPAALGNSWTFATAVPLEDSSFSSIKALFRP